MDTRGTVVRHHRLVEVGQVFSEALVEDLRAPWGPVGVQRLVDLEVDFVPDLPLEEEEDRQESLVRPLLSLLVALGFLERLDRHLVNQPVDLDLERDSIQLRAHLCLVVVGLERLGSNRNQAALCLVVSSPVLRFLEIRAEVVSDRLLVALSHLGQTFLVSPPEHRSSAAAHRRSAIPVVVYSRTLVASVLEVDSLRVTSLVARDPRHLFLVKPPVSQTSLDNSLHLLDSLLHCLVQCRKVQLRLVRSLALPKRRPTTLQHFSTSGQTISSSHSQDQEAILRTLHGNKIPLLATPTGLRNMAWSSLSFPSIAKESTPISILTTPLAYLQ